MIIYGLLYVSGHIHDKHIKGPIAPPPIHVHIIYSTCNKNLDANVTFVITLKWLTLVSLGWLWDSMTHIESFSLSAFSYSANMNFVRHGGLGLQCNHEKMSIISAINSMQFLSFSTTNT